MKYKKYKLMITNYTYNTKTTMYSHSYKSPTTTNTSIHPFREYITSLYFLSNNKLVKIKSNSMPSASGPNPPLRVKLMICNMIQFTSKAMKQPAYISMRFYPNDLKLIKFKEGGNSNNNHSSNSNTVSNTKDNTKLLTINLSLRQSTTVMV
ncbi:hypothetical protein K502DRAFT_59067 [Neoconidiobolus thromboides FSU 785]|nr:hypothetical protein K502DRAFT_59067 [Neoconidiobolus thromboides FSU 785]